MGVGVSPRSIVRLSTGNLPKLTFVHSRARQFPAHRPTEVYRGSPLCLFLSPSPSPYPPSSVLSSVPHPPTPIREMKAISTSLYIIWKNYCG